MAMQVNTKDVDRLSDLHDSILSHILSFVSTKESVGTSVLSTRWRHLYTLVSNLDFDDDLCHKELETLLDFQFDDCRKCSTVKSFMCFLDQVLLLRKTSLDEFRLRCKGRIDSSRIRGWISAAVSCGVKHLHLNISSLQDFTLPGVLFTCRTLETLNLAMNFRFVFDVPEYVHLPSLKTLYLKSAKFLNDDSVKRLFSRCTSLEELVLESCVMENINNFSISHQFLKRLTILQTLDSFDIHELMIEAKNLAYFKYFDELLAGYSLENLQSLVKADISSYRYLQPDASAAALFRGICNVRSLILSTTSLELLSSCEPLPSFATLVKLKIWYCFGDIWSTSMDKGLENLLSNSPELEQLDFDKVFLSFVPEKALSSLLLKFKAIEISGFVDDTDCIGKAKYILMNGTVLEKLTIYTAPNVSAEKNLEISEVLLASPRKSKQCLILVV